LSPKYEIARRSRPTAGRLTGCEIEYAYVDKGYRGDYAANPRRVFIAGQERGRRTTAAGDPAER
jgi:hypothetical protein